MDTAILAQIMSLVTDARTIIVSSIDEEGYPNSKQMFKRVHRGLETFWFSTNTSSMRTRQFSANSKACLYFAGAKDGLMLIGEMQVCHDRESKTMIWKEGDEKYYALGIDDPDYCVFVFTAESGNYYSSMNTYTFSIEEVIQNAVCFMQ
ncbi:MAG: hypothetical protein K0Q59_3144 [Paenibacillus sp.]|jgi:general stress protein 26|nr:hypothetical protein [Paenibacillus sp.]